MDIRGTIPNKVSMSGPGKEEGPLPAFFYFYIGGRDTIELTPCNQPAIALKGKPIRIFSWDIPYHTPGCDPSFALNQWDNDPHLMTSFIEKSKQIIADLIQDKWVNPEKMGIGGLSRGGFIATSIASHIEQIKTLVAFAPLTKFSDELTLFPVNESLLYKKIRFYIGNHDERVGTDNCFKWIHELAKRGKEKRIRPYPGELIISPSIGHKGHGTPKEIFTDGALWLWSTLQ
ncbi:S9 family peptidase [Chlamydiales bacterium]|nr:S9 family peptidase [Chlamydiales bacterium]